MRSWGVICLLRSNLTLANTLLNQFKLRYPIPIPILSNFIDSCFKRDTCHSQHVTRGKVMTQLLIGHWFYLPFSDWPIELTPSESKSQSQISIRATWWGHAGRAARKDALCWWFVFHLMAKMWGLGFKTWQMGWWSRWEDMKIFDGKEDAQLQFIICMIWRYAMNATSGSG